MDVLSRRQRSYCMSRIRGKNTKPEMAVRSIVRSLGYRYRLHAASVPGKPDLVLTGQRKLIFVHGCFWHRHRCRLGRVTPATNTSFWLEKFAGNVARDRRVRRRLRAKGWKSLVVWECQVRSARAAVRIARFLGSE